MKKLQQFPALFFTLLFLLPGLITVSFSRVSAQCDGLYVGTILNTSGDECNTLTPQNIQFTAACTIVADPYTFVWKCTGVGEPYPVTETIVNAIASGAKTITGNASIDCVRAGVENFSVTITDANGCTASLPYTFTTVLCGPKTKPDSTPSVLCICGTGTIKYVTADIAPGNVYTVQLSDSGGNFTKPDTIGSSASSSATGYINITIPCNLIPGKHYLIRIMPSMTHNNVPAQIETDTLSLYADSTTDLSLNLFGSPTSICQGQNVALIATPSFGSGNTPPNGSTTYYKWYLDNNRISNLSVNTLDSTGFHNGDSIYAVISTNACLKSPVDSVSNKVLITVNSTNPPTVSIAASGGTTICSAACVTFTATSMNAGLTPIYKWSVNGGPPLQSSTSNTWNYCNFNNGDVVTCVLTSSNLCASPLTATSNAITITIIAPLTPAVSVTNLPAAPLCTGESITFTATATDTGTGATPVTYQWKVGGVLQVGATSRTFTTSFATAVPETVTCTITTSFACVTSATATGNDNITIIQTVTPSVTLSLLPGASICLGAADTVIADINNGGTAPTYQWYLNGILSTTKDTFSTSAYSLGPNKVKVVLTSNATCATTTTYADSVTITTSQNQVPLVSISPLDTTICSGSTVTFTATPTNGGIPTYAWSVVGGPTLQNSASNTFTYTATTAATIKCIMTSSLGCVTTSTASTTSAITLLTPSTPTVTISANPSGPICTGTSITFNAIPVNAGTGATYNWYFAGNPDTQGVSTNFTYNFTTAESVYCIMTAGTGCISPATATSNTIAVIISPVVVPKISIGLTALSGTLCPNTSLTFTSTQTGGNSYNWIVDGVRVNGASGSTYGPITLSAGSHTIEDSLTSSSQCAVPTTAAHDTTITILPTTTASVSITASPAGGVVCNGQSLTFTATPTNGGAAPTYDWYVNSTTTPVVTGSASNTYTTSAFIVGTNNVYCVLHSNFPCVTNSPVQSNTITFTVNPVLVPAITISANPTGAVCSGTSVIFTPTNPQNGGTPTYDWYIVGTAVPVATNSPTYTYVAGGSSVQVYCVMHSTATCANPDSAISPDYTVTISSVIVPTVSINVTAPNPVCPSSSVTFTATVTGAPGIYVWTDNTGTVGTNSPTYTPASLTGGTSYSVTCTFTSNSACASPTTATNSSTITVQANVNASVGAITLSNNTPYCPNTPITFTADTTNAGHNPTYKWQATGQAAVNTTVPTYTTMLPAPGGVTPYTVTCTMTSDAACVNIPTVSNNIDVVVNPTLTTVVTLGVNPTGSVCSNQSDVTLTANVTNGGTPPKFQWFMDGTPVGTNSNTYTTPNNLTPMNHVFKCIDTSNATCLTNPNDTASASYVLSVVNDVTPALNITPPSGVLCPGQSLTFIAHPTNRGNTPAYQWTLDGSPVVPANNDSIYTIPAGLSSTPSQHTISCTFTSSIICVTTPTATASVTINITPNVTASVSLASVPTGSICQGMPIIFTADTTNAGIAPLPFSWTLDGPNPAPGASNTSLTYNTSTLTPGAHTITFTMTSNANCVLGSPASAPVTVTILPTVTADITIGSTYNGAPICPNTLLIDTSVVTSAGTYQWLLDSVPVSTQTNSTFDVNIGTPGVHHINCVITSNNICPGTPDTSNSITVNVVSTLPASVSITSVPAGPICPGTLVAFTAVAVNGGTPPFYQWQIDSDNTGTDSDTMSTSTLTPGTHTIQCIMTSALTCATGSPATSNPINILVNPNVQTSVTISSNVDTACAGVTINFTASSVNGGTSPGFQWKTTSTGNVPGATDSTYNPANLNNGDIVSCIITSDAQCVTNSPANSTNTIQVTINPLLTPTITVAANKNNVCQGTPITFTATETLGGSSPFYQWFVGIAQVGTNSPTFTDSTLAAGSNVIKCSMAADTTCLASNSPVVDSVTVTINPYVVSSITISTEDTNVCAGSPVIFNSGIQNGGTTPQYDWQLNGASQNDNSDVYNADTVSNNDVIMCILTSNAQCNHNPVDTSNILKMSVTPIPIVHASPDTGAINTCFGNLIPLSVTGAETYTWNPSTGLSCSTCASVIASPDNSTTYTVTGMTNGCASDTTVIINIGCKYIFAPTLFTPGVGTSANQVFKIYGPQVHNFSIIIFDRWGEEIYESTDQTVGWDGTYKGKNVDPGVYVYVIKGDVAGNALSVNGVLAGDVTLLR